MTSDNVLEDSAFLTNPAVDGTDDKLFDDIVRIGRSILHIVGVSSVSMLQAID